MLVLVAIVLAILVLPHPWGIVVVAAAVLVDTAETVLFVRWSKRRRAAVGTEALVGRTAVAVDELRPEGQVKVDGELWRARCDAGADAGAVVRVLAVEGLTLEVEPA